MYMVFYNVRIDMAKRKRRLRSATDQARIYRKTQILMAEGMPPKQATAVAFRMYRDGELPQAQHSRMQRTRTASISKTLATLAGIVATKKKKR